MSGEQTGQGWKLIVVDDVTVPGTPALLAISNITDIGEFGSETDDLETTDLDSVAKEYIQGLPDNGTMQLQLNLNTGSVGHKVLWKLSKLGGDTRKHFAVLSGEGEDLPTVTGGNFVWTGVTDRQYFAFDAGVKSFKFPAAVNQVVKATCNLRLSGGITSSLDD